MTLLLTSSVPGFPCGGAMHNHKNTEKAEKMKSTNSSSAVSGFRTTWQSGLFYFALQNKFSVGNASHLKLDWSMICPLFNVSQTSVKFSNSVPMWFADLPNGEGKINTLGNIQQLYFSDGFYWPTAVSSETLKGISNKIAQFFSEGIWIRLLCLLV